MKKIIRLTESELKQTIKRMLIENINENHFDYEDWFDEPDPVKDAHNKYYDVENGHYDNAIEDLYEKGYDETEIIEKLFGEYDPDFDSELADLIVDKLATWNKDIAMKTNKGWPKDYNGYPHNADSVFKMNKFDQERDKKDAMDKFTSSQDAKKFPELLKKTGEPRTSKQIVKNITNRNNKYGAELAADKAPLHRKGSLNRDVQ